MLGDGRRGEGNGQNGTEEEGRGGERIEDGWGYNWEVKTDMFTEEDKKREKK